MAAILVVDDDDNIRRVLLSILKKMGHDVREAADGLSAFEVYREALPNLVLSDLYMPDQDGFETIRALRKEAPDLKVVAAGLARLLRQIQ